MEPQKTVIAESIKELTELGYDSFSKRIVHHDEFGSTHHMHYWTSQVMKASKEHRLDYNKWLTPKPLLDDDSCVEIVTIAEFINSLDDSVVDISIRFIKDRQAFTCYTQCLSTRSIYAWGNNTYITHVTDSYDSDGPETWTCDIAKYEMYKQLWYPVNVIAHSPWHNKETSENSIINSNYICFGIDQNPDMSSIGKSILPHADDIQNVSTCPTELLKDDIKAYSDLYNNQMVHEVYKFNTDNRTGWLFVAVSGFVYTKDLLVMTVDKRGKKRYFSFS